MITTTTKKRLLAVAMLPLLAACNADDGAGTGTAAPTSSAPAEQAPSEEAPSEEAPSEEAPSEEAPAEDATQAPTEPSDSATEPAEEGGDATQADVARNMVIPAGVCGNGEGDVGWNQNSPIKLKEGEGEKFDDPSDPTAGGASIDKVRLLKYTDMDGDGQKDYVLAMNCSGTPKEQCCAGKASKLNVVAIVADKGNDTRQIGKTLWGSTGKGGTEDPLEFVEGSQKFQGDTLVAKLRKIYAKSEAEATPVMAAYDWKNGEWSMRPY